MHAAKYSVNPSAIFEQVSHSLSSGCLSLASVRRCVSVINTWVCSLEMSGLLGTSTSFSDSLPCVGHLSTWQEP